VLARGFAAAGAEVCLIGRSGGKDDEAPGYADEAGRVPGSERIGSLTMAVHERAKHDWNLHNGHTVGSRANE
jgi:hypothetical protein